MEANLRKILLRVGEGEYNPDLQIVTMDGFNAASTSDVDEMRRPQMELLAKGKIPGYRALKVDALRAALKKYMAENPGIIQLPGQSTQSSSSIPAISINPVEAPFNIATNAVPAPPTTVSTETEPCEATDEGPDVNDPILCACLECDEAAVSWCEQCQLSFCNQLHAAHASHKFQTKKNGKTSAFVWDNPIPPEDTVSPMPQISPMPPTIDITATASQKRKATYDVVTTQQKGTVFEAQTGSFRLEGDNPGKRATLEKQKQLEALDFIESLRTSNALDYNITYNKFNYQNYYDVQFISSIADTLHIDLSEITCKKRYSHKELLNCFITKLIN